jgi:hypothetical protein
MDVYYPSKIHQKTYFAIVKGERVKWFGEAETPDEAMLDMIHNIFDAARENLGYGAEAINLKASETLGLISDYQVFVLQIDANQFQQFLDDEPNYAVISQYFAVYDSEEESIDFFPVTIKEGIVQPPPGYRLLTPGESPRTGDFGTTRPVINSQTGQVSPLGKSLIWIKIEDVKRWGSRTLFARRCE